MIRNTRCQISLGTALAVALMGFGPIAPVSASSTEPAKAGVPIAAQDDDKEEATEQVVVSSTRTQVLMKDEPIHVEAVPAEEIEENLTKTPGSVSTVFLELPGMHVKSAAPGLGGAIIQLRGMARSEHTSVDGRSSATRCRA